MTAHDEHPAPTGEAPAHEHGHPGAKEYLAIAMVLSVLTAIEVAVFYIPSLKSILVPALLTLSTVKFALVAMFYMHLRYESLAYTVIFATLLLFAMVVTFSVFILIRAFFGLI